MTGADLSDPAKFWCLLGTLSTLYVLGWLLATHLRPRFAEDDAGSGRWLPR